MKYKIAKKITMALVFACSATAFGQVGIGTTAPHASSELDLGSGNKALYLNRVATTAAVANPQPGMMIYDLSEHCVKVFEGTPAAWSECLGVSDVGKASLTCSSAAFSPAIAGLGQAYTGTLTIPYTGGNDKPYPAQSFTENGLTFTLPAGSFNTGTGNLVYNITGTPITIGEITVNITAGGQSCNGLTLNVTAPNNPIGTGSLSGRMCFDVVEVNNGGDCGLLANRMTQKAYFDQTVTNTQTYTFKPTGTVSNIRFIYVNTNGQVIQSLTPDADYSGTLTSSQTATATVVYFNNLNITASSLTRDNAFLGDIFAVYNDGVTNNGTDHQLKLTVRVQDCACCGAMISPTVWKNFMCHNLGADESLDPFTPAPGIHGAVYKWGRSTPAMTQAENLNPSYNGSYSAWASKPIETANTWNMTTQNPCPTGFRVPTGAEWSGVAANNTYVRIGTWSTSLYDHTNYSAMVYMGPNGSYTLPLPAAGWRGREGASSPAGALYDRAQRVSLWSTTVGACGSMCIGGFGVWSNVAPYYSENAAGGTGQDGKRYGKSIRCIEN